MQANRLSAQHGKQWLLAGWALFRKRPWAYMLLLSTYLLCAAVLNAIPYLGVFIVGIVTPFLWVVLMQCCRQLSTGQAIHRDTLSSTFKNPPPVLLYLGLTYMAYVLCVLALSAMVDDGLFAQTALGFRQPDPSDMDNPAIAKAGQLALLLLFPAMLACSFAPPLIAWQKFNLGKALFFSFMVYLRHWRAFLAYTFWIAVCGLLLPALLMGVLTAFLPSASPLWLALCGGFYTLCLAPVALTSFYVSYCQIFEANADALAH